MITVSIVTYKTNLEELSKCLQSLTSSLVSQIYIVDNSNERYIADFVSNTPMWYILIVKMWAMEQGITKHWERYSTQVENIIWFLIRMSILNLRFGTFGSIYGCSCGCSTGTAQCSIPWWRAAIYLSSSSHTC